MLLEASCGVLEHFGEDVLRCRDRSGEAHVAGGWVDVAFRHVGDHRGDQRIPELLRNFSGLVPHQVVVFPERHMRTVLLGTAGRDDDGRLPAGDRVASLHPGGLFEKHAVRLRDERGLCGCARDHAGEADDCRSGRQTAFGPRDGHRIRRRDAGGASVAG